MDDEGCLAEYLGVTCDLPAGHDPPCGVAIAGTRYRMQWRVADGRRHLPPSVVPCADGVAGEAR